jgi:hypothetical protein
LKRVREKEVKAVGPEEGAALVEIPPEMEANKPTKPAKAALAASAIDEADGKKEKSHDQVR